MVMFRGKRRRSKQDKSSEGCRNCGIGVCRTDRKAYVGGDAETQASLIMWVNETLCLLNGDLMQVKRLLKCRR